MIDNFPHEAPLRDRLLELFKLEDEVLNHEGARAHMALIGFDDFMPPIQPPRDYFDRAFMRVHYENKYVGRVDKWDDFHAIMFKTIYGFHLYAEDERP